MIRLSVRNLVIAVLVTATVLVAGMASFRTGAVADAPPPPHYSTLVPF